MRPRFAGGTRGAWRACHRAIRTATACICREKPCRSRWSGARRAASAWKSRARGPTWMAVSSTSRGGFATYRGEEQQDVASDVTGLLHAWVRSHPDFVLGSNEAGMPLEGEVRGRRDLAARGGRRVPGPRRRRGVARADGRARCDRARRFRRELPSERREAAARWSAAGSGARGGRVLLAARSRVAKRTGKLGPLSCRACSRSGSARVPRGGML